ncbi:hypothetical protein ACQP1P_35345 [Dactylosporangium sp. CA-052675]|uniref:hypothetical protein n=1 Tax=Dactylosporangium sp. CA-052675 TaxID=3239927 RepID=UPI003D91EADB
MQTRTRIRRTGIAALTTLVASAAVTLTLAAPAHADSWVIGCNGSGINNYSRGACGGGTTGGKNYTNHTQWVGWVTAYRAGLEHNPIVKVESWGDGFYFSANAESGTWGAQRWVRSGTNVCGAVTYDDGARFIACISISV